jgi:hypothetical protein
VSQAWRKGSTNIVRGGGLQYLENTKKRNGKPGQRAFGSLFYSEDRGIEAAHSSETLQMIYQTTLNPEILECKVGKEYDISDLMIFTEHLPLKPHC